MRVVVRSTLAIACGLLVLRASAQRLDPDFDPSVTYVSSATFTPDPHDASVTALALQPDGRLLVAGTFNQVAGVRIDEDVVVSGADGGTGRALVEIYDLDP